jgi:hypothetical protein
MSKHIEPEKAESEFTLYFPRPATPEQAGRVEIWDTSDRLKPSVVVVFDCPHDFRIKFQDAAKRRRLRTMP